MVGASLRPLKYLILTLIMVPVLAGCQSGDVPPRDQSHLEESVQITASLSTTDTINLAESVELAIIRRSDSSVTKSQSCNDGGPGRP